MEMNGAASASPEKKNEPLHNDMNGAASTTPEQYKKSHHVDLNRAINATSKTTTATKSVTYKLLEQEQMKMEAMENLELSSRLAAQRSEQELYVARTKLHLTTRDLKPLIQENLKIQEKAKKCSKAVIKQEKIAEKLKALVAQDNSDIFNGMTVKTLRNLLKYVEAKTAA